MQITRRDFIKVGAAGTGAAAVTSLGFDAQSAIQVKQSLRIAGAKEVHSLCPYCAVGCSIVAYTAQDATGHARLLQIEGDPDSPVNEGRLCPKGATAMQLAVSNRRIEKPLYRAPGSDQWVELKWVDAAEKIARKIKQVRDDTWIATEKVGDAEVPVNRTDAIGFMGGAQNTNEECYLFQKAARLLGTAFVEHQARL